MQRTALLPLLLGTVTSASRLHRSHVGLAAGERDHPVEKVILLLKDLSAQVLKQSQEEEYLYGKFDKWCKDTDRTLSKAISAGREKIDSLKDKVSSLEKEEKSLTKQIDVLGEEILEHEAASEKAKQVRDDENKLWQDADKDLELTIGAISEVLEIMKSAKTETSGLLQTKVRALLQVPTLLAQVTSRQKELLLGAAGQAPDPADAEAETTPRPEMLSKGDLSAHQSVYVFKSGNVIELLKSLQAKFEEDRVDATKAETSAANAYELSEDARQKAIATATSAKKEKETILGDVQSDLEETKGTLKSCIDDLEADEKSLASTEESCKLKAGEYATRVELQQGEQAAMAKAIEILSDVTGVRTEQPTNPVPPPSPLESFLQLPPQASPRRQEALALLRRAAGRTRSQEFADLVEEVSAAADGPFKVVSEMMQKMIFRLMAEQKDEDEHKVWCDKELEEVNISMTDKGEKIETLEAKITDGKAKVGELAEEIKDADEMVATLENHMEEATAVREAAKAENKAAIKDAQDAQTAIAQATAVLEQFYKESGAIKKEAWEFVQREPVVVPEHPSTWDASYTGIADPSNAPDGIISMLKDISADFAKMEADTLATEEMDQKAYESEIKDCKIEKAERMKESEMKAAEKGRLLDKIAALEKTLKHTSNELEMVEQYLRDLGPACLDGDSTYETRKAARQSEIEALKEAQVILEQAFEEDSAPAPAGRFAQLARRSRAPLVLLEVGQDKAEQPSAHAGAIRSRIARQMSALGRAAQPRAERAEAPEPAKAEAAGEEGEEAKPKTVLLSPHAGYWGRGIKARILEETSGERPAQTATVSAARAAPAALPEAHPGEAATPSMRGPVKPPAVAAVGAAGNATGGSGGGGEGPVHSVMSLVSSFFGRLLH